MTSLGCPNVSPPDAGQSLTWPRGCCCGDIALQWSGSTGLWCGACESCHGGSIRTSICHFLHISGWKKIGLPDIYRSTCALHLCSILSVLSDMSLWCVSGEYSTKLVVTDNSTSSSLSADALLLRASYHQLGWLHDHGGWRAAQVWRSASAQTPRREGHWRPQPSVKGYLLA